MNSLKINVPQGFEIDKEKSSFEEIVFKSVKKDVFERINSLRDAINDLGEYDEEVRQLRLLYSLKGLSRKIVAEQEITVVCKALNEDWVPDFTDTKQYKYFAYWDLSSGKARLYYVYDYYSSYAFCSSRLCTKTEKLYKHLVNVMLPQFQEYL